MNIYILFWVKSFSLAHPICQCFKYENVKTKHLVYIVFKVRLKAKTYGVNFLVASLLQLKMFSHKRLAIKKFIPYVFNFHSHLEKPHLS
jgi:hypothetical protein